MPIGVILTVIASLISILVTYRSQKSQKFIDTITSERIKWLDKVRSEVSILSSWIMTFVKTKIELEELYSHEQEILNDGGFNDPYKDVYAPQDEENLRIVRSQKKKLNEELDSGYSKKEIVERIILLKLRLNPREDDELIKILEHLYNIFSEANLTIDTVKQSLDEVEKLVNLTQAILKAEWEKVKIESIKGHKSIN
jgi:flagellin-specific chaperone FliS